MPGRHHEDDVNLVMGQPEARALTARASGYRMDGETENFLVASAVRASDGHHGHSSPRGDGADNLIAFQPNSSRTDEEWRADQSPPIKKGSGGNGAVPPAISGGMGVRRLTPLECERLMGWPDEHTRYTADGKELSDSHRYRLCGNGVVAPVAEWLGHRLMAACQT
jgi:DNA (cytosine-5)-methyltransferase 1